MVQLVFELSTYLFGLSLEPHTEGSMEPYISQYSTPIPALVWQVLTMMGEALSPIPNSTFIAVL